MKKILFACILFFINSSVFSVSDGSQWIYVESASVGTGMGYTGVASLQYAGDFFYNPASPSFIKNFTIFGNTTIFSKDFLLNAGVAIPLPYGVITAAGKFQNSKKLVGNVNAFQIGFSKALSKNFCLGFKGSFYNQVALSSATNSNFISDIGVAFDVGAVFILPDVFQNADGFTIKKNTFGITIHGLGKPSAVHRDSPIPAMGFRAGYGFQWIETKNFNVFSSIEGTFDFFPSNCYGSFGLTLELFNIFKLRGGLIYGNNGIGNISEGLSIYTLGASLCYTFGEIPIEIFYSYNPAVFKSIPEDSHFIGFEIGFGSLDRKGPEIKLEIEGLVSNTIYVSPNYDGSQDLLDIGLNIKDENSIVDWKLFILNEKREIVRSFYGEEERDVAFDFNVLWKKLWIKNEVVPVPERIYWDGTSDRGEHLPDGVYYLFAEATDELNNRGVSTTNKIILDTTPPSGSLSLFNNIISPNGDGRNDSIIISQNLSGGDLWKGEIRDSEGSKIKEWIWNNDPPMNLEWDGRDENKRIVQEGTYNYIVYGTDMAGNKLLLTIPDIYLSLKQYSVFISIDKKYFSPAFESLKIKTFFMETNGLKEWILTIKDANGIKVKEIKDKIIPSYLYWDGTDLRNKRVGDGNYKISLSATYQNGETSFSRGVDVIVDSTPPVLRFSSSPEIFAPDGDGENEELLINFSTVDLSGIRRWKIEIMDPDNKPFKVFEGKGEPSKNIRWNGRSDNGELVESAQDYRVVIFAEDEAGNKIEKEVGKIKVDVLVEKMERGLRIRINNIEFEFGKATLMQKKKLILDRVVEILQKYNRYRVEIQGHTDNIGSEQKNKELSIARARTVYDYLVAHGINRNRLSLNGFGYKYPIADNSTEEGRRKNRRVEFILQKD